MNQRANTERARAQEAMFPAEDRKMMDAAISTLQCMSTDERRFAMAFMRGMRFQRMADSAAKTQPGAVRPGA